MKKRYTLILLLIVALAIALWFFFFYQPVYTAKMSELARPRQDGLRVGPAMLGWSTASKTNGYIYMRDMFGSTNALWDFALTTNKSLSNVKREDLQCTYYGLDDPRGSNEFGAAWFKDAIRVPEGQIFFARLVTNQSVVYAIKLAHQEIVSNEGKVQIRYRVFRQVPPNTARGCVKSP